MRSGASVWILLAATATGLCRGGGAVDHLAAVADVERRLVRDGQRLRQTAPASAPQAPAVPAIEVPSANAVTPQAPAVASVPATVESNSEASVPVASGMLRIVTQPEGATVTVDGESRGVSPVRVDRLSLGAHSVSASLADIRLRGRAFS